MIIFPKFFYTSSINYSFWLFKKFKSSSYNFKKLSRFKAKVCQYFLKPLHFKNLIFSRSSSTIAWMKFFIFYTQSEKNNRILYIHMIDSLVSGRQKITRGGRGLLIRVGDVQTPMDVHASSNERVHRPRSRWISHSFANNKDSLLLFLFLFRK